MELTVPSISVIIGEGGSGGAIALASTNKVLMLENSIYSVISPEGCATILWRDPKKTLEAAQAMKISANDLLDLKVIDEIIDEPIGGAHRDKDLVIDNVRTSIRKNLKEIKSMEREEIFNHRKNKFLSIGRSKGFISKSTDYDNLTIKQDFKNKINTFFVKFKLEIIISTSVIIFIFSLFYLL
jgi:acetyl-CoA carboxylase carboxyl transferase subunit alpha